METAEAVEPEAAAVGTEAVEAAAVGTTEAVEITKPVETRTTASVMTFLAFFFNISENLFLEILALKKTELG